MNAGVDPDTHASLVQSQMTQAEKLSLIRGWLGIPYRPGTTGPFQGNKDFTDVVGSSGYVPGIPRLGIPSLQESDAGLGVANVMGMLRPGDVATALPSSLSLAATFNPMLAYQGGAMIGREAWRKGLNLLLAGGVNLVRDPRNGRNFEYLGEDPLLVGTLAGQSIRGIQDQPVLSTTKHFALNDQETHRNSANAVIDEAAMRESDLLAFEFAIEGGSPGSVMCSYNLINSRHGCENDHLLNDVLKGDWRYPGWVMSDWGAVHSVLSANSGLDQESAAIMDQTPFFGQPFVDALQAGTIPQVRLEDMTHRILRSMFSVGLIDYPAARSEIDYKANSEVALHAAEEGIVLLKNKANLLPLAATAKRIAVIGGYADAGILSGGGSLQVFAVGGLGAAVQVGGGDPLFAEMHKMIFHPSAPLEAIRALAAGAEVWFVNGRYPSSAAALAKWADVVIVFGIQWTYEGEDVPDLSLPGGQNELIAIVAAANPKTVVVLETGGAVEMPWLDAVGAVVEAWYPGQRGGEAIANVLYGTVNPSGHLPVTFPKNSNQNSRSVIPGIELPEGSQFDVVYTEGSDVGYRWFAKNKLQPLFPFGYGLSYATFEYSNLAVQVGQSPSVTFDVVNTGKIAGSAVPQLYLTSRRGDTLQRLIGFSKVSLQPGAREHVSLRIDPRLLADFDASANNWWISADTYTMTLGQSATERGLTRSVEFEDGTISP